MDVALRPWRASSAPLAVTMEFTRSDFPFGRSPRRGELNGDSRDRDAQQGGALDFDAFDVVDVKLQPDDRVRAVFFRFADQFPHGREPIRFSARRRLPRATRPPP